MNKPKILEKVIEEVEAEIKRLQAGVEHAKHAKLEAPGRMQSRYDTMGIEASWVADGLAKTLSEKTDSLQKLSSFRLPDSTDRVIVGSLVGLGPASGGAEDFYFILPGGGGVTYVAEDSELEVSVISPQAPIAKALLGKGPREEILIRAQGQRRTIVYLS